MFKNENGCIIIGIKYLILNDINFVFQNGLQM